MRRLMFPLVRRIVMLTILFTWTILSSRLVGSAQPLPFSALFTYPDGSPCESPCIFGVRPGYTTHKDAIALLQSHPLARHLRQTAFESVADNFSGEDITISVA